jgi:hypothetical protein
VQADWNSAADLGRSVASLEPLQPTLRLPNVTGSPKSGPSSARISLMTKTSCDLAPASRLSRLCSPSCSIEYVGNCGLFGLLPSAHVLTHLLHFFIAEMVGTVLVDTT